MAGMLWEHLSAGDQGQDILHLLPQGRLLVRLLHLNLLPPRALGWGRRGRRAWARLLALRCTWGPHGSTLLAGGSSRHCTWRSRGCWEQQQLARHLAVWLLLVLCLHVWL